jgi:integrase/recombinase XerD
MRSKHQPFNSLQMANKIPLTTIKNWLGHARIETTAIYLDVQGDEERELAGRTWEL